MTTHTMYWLKLLKAVPAVVGLFAALFPAIPGLGVFAAALYLLAALLE